MPEKKYPPRFDFKKLEPDVPVEFTLLKKPFSGKAKNDKGEEYEWHLWAVKHTGIEMSLFTPNERVHAGLLSLKVKPGDKFVITKKPGWNKDTGNQFIYYEMTCDGQTIDTKDTPPPPGNDRGYVKPKEDPLADTLVIEDPTPGYRLKEPEKVAPATPQTDYVALFERYYGPIMTTKLKYFETRINVQKLTDGQFAEIMIALDKSTSRNVTSMLIEGNK